MLKRLNNGIYYIAIDTVYKCYAVNYEKENCFISEKAYNEYTKFNDPIYLELYDKNCKWFKTFEEAKETLLIRKEKEFQDDRDFELNSHLYEMKEIKNLKEQNV